ncbi:MAG: type IV pilus assembly protein PilM [Planctomycetes bacterium]|nr:type IV pilus assembly protein PilM [Planctomycetota bacterium]
MGKGVWGIDISKFSAKAVRLERGANGVMLTHTGVIPYAGTDTGEPVNLDDQIRLALATMKSKYKIGGERVALSLPGHSTFNRLIKLPPVEESKLHEVVKYEAQSQIPFPIDEVIWDFQFVERHYGPGEEKEVILFAIKKEIVEQLLANIQDIGLNVEAIQFGPVALYNFLSYDQEISHSCIAVDMGADNADLLIIDGPKFWIRNLPITGNDITKALQKAFNIPFAEAEKLKLRAGQSPQAQKVFNAMQPVLRDLIGEVHRSIGYYKSISRQVRFEKVLLLGNATRVLNFQKFVSQTLQLPAARISALHRIQIGGNLDAAQVAESLTTIGTALGLALQGLGDTKNQVNLLPTTFIKRRELRRKQPFTVGVVALLYLLVGLMWFNANASVSELSKEVNDGSKMQNELKGLAGELEAVRASAANFEIPLQRLEALRQDKDLILLVMNLLHPNIPNNSAPNIQQVDQTWILEWKFEDMPLQPPAVAPSRAGTAPVSGSVTWDPKRKLVIRIEVALLAANRSDSRLEEHLLQNFLGTMQAGTTWRKNPNRSSVVDAFQLTRAMEGPRRFEVKPLGRANELKPWSLQERTESDGKYAIFQVILEIPYQQEQPEQGAS